MIQDEKIAYSFYQLSKWLRLKDIDVDKQFINLLDRLSDSKSSVITIAAEAEVLFEELPKALSLLFRTHYPNDKLIVSVLNCLYPFLRDLSSQLVLSSLYFSFLKRMQSRLQEYDQFTSALICYQHGVEAKSSSQWQLEQFSWLTSMATDERCPTEVIEKLTLEVLSLMQRLELARTDPIQWTNWIIPERPVTKITENQSLPWIQLVYHCPHLQYEHCQLVLEQGLIAYQHMENSTNPISRIRDTLFDLWMHSSKLVGKDKNQEWCHQWHHHLIFQVIPLIPEPKAVSNDLNRDKKWHIVKQLLIQWQALLQLHWPAQWSKEEIKESKKIENLFNHTKEQWQQLLNKFSQRENCTDLLLEISAYQQHLIETINQMKPIECRPLWARKLRDDIFEAQSTQAFFKSHKELLSRDFKEIKQAFNVDLLKIKNILWKNVEVGEFKDPNSIEDLTKNLVIYALNLLGTPPVPLQVCLTGSMVTGIFAEASDIDLEVLIKEDVVEARDYVKKFYQLLTWLAIPLKLEVDPDCKHAHTPWQLADETWIQARANNGITQLISQAATYARWNLRSLYATSGGEHLFQEYQRYFERLFKVKEYKGLSQNLPRSSKEEECFKDSKPFYLQKRKQDVFFQALSEKLGCTGFDELLIQFEKLIIYLNEASIKLIQNSVFDFLLNETDLFELTQDIEMYVSQYKKAIRLLIQYSLPLTLIQNYRDRNELQKILENYRDLIEQKSKEKKLKPEEEKSKLLLTDEHFRELNKIVLGAIEARKQILDNFTLNWVDWCRKLLKIQRNQSKILKITVLLLAKQRDLLIRFWRLNDKAEFIFVKEEGPFDEENDLKGHDVLLDKNPHWLSDMTLQAIPSNEFKTEELGILNYKTKWVREYRLYSMGGPITAECFLTVSYLKLWIDDIKAQPSLVTNERLECIELKSHYQGPLTRLVNFLARLAYINLEIKDPFPLHTFQQLDFLQEKRFFSVTFTLIFKAILNTINQFRRRAHHIYLNNPLYPEIRKKKDILFLPNKLPKNYIKEAELNKEELAGLKNLENVLLTALINHVSGWFQPLSLPIAWDPIELSLKNASLDQEKWVTSLAHLLLFLRIPVQNFESYCQFMKPKQFSIFKAVLLTNSREEKQGDPYIHLVAKAISAYPPHAGIRSFSIWEEIEAKWQEQLLLLTMDSQMEHEKEVPQLYWYNPVTKKEVHRGLRLKDSENLFSKESKLPILDQKKRATMGGMRIVISLYDPHQSEKIIAYLKCFPQWPLRQRLASMTDYQLTGDYLPHTQIRLFHPKTKRYYPILISKARGQAVKEQLPFKENKSSVSLVDNIKLYELPEILRGLDLHYFALGAIQSLILGFGDASPANLSIDEAMAFLRLFAHDADCLFADTWEKNREWLFWQSSKPGLKSLYFCMPQMLQPIPDTAIDLFGQFAAYALIDNLLKMLKDEEKQYTQALTQSSEEKSRLIWSTDQILEFAKGKHPEQTPEDRCCLRMIFPPDKIFTLYKRILDVQSWLREQQGRARRNRLPNPTLVDLVSSFTDSYFGPQINFLLNRPELGPHERLSLLLNPTFIKQIETYIKERNPIIQNQALPSVTHSIRTSQMLNIKKEIGESSSVNLSRGSVETFFETYDLEEKYKKCHAELTQAFVTYSGKYAIKIRDDVLSGDIEQFRVLLAGQLQGTTVEKTLQEIGRDPRKIGDATQLQLIPLLSHFNFSFQVLNFAKWTLLKVDDLAPLLYHSGKHLTRLRLIDNWRLDTSIGSLMMRNNFNLLFLDIGGKNNCIRIGDYQDPLSFPHLRRLNLHHLQATQRIHVDCPSLVKIKIKYCQPLWLVAIHARQLKEIHFKGLPSLMELQLNCERYPSLLSLALGYYLELSDIPIERGVLIERLSQIQWNGNKQDLTSLLLLILDYYYESKGIDIEPRVLIKLLNQKLSLPSSHCDSRVNRTILLEYSWLIAAHIGDLDTLNRVWSLVKNVDALRQLTDHLENSALHLAVLSSQLPAVEWLCKNNIPLEKRNLQGHTPLTLAVCDNNIKIEIIACLIRCHALITARYQGQNLLTIALQNKSSIVSAILESTIKSRDHQDTLPSIPSLWHAAYNNDLKSPALAKKSLETSLAELTPLSVAAMRGHEEFFKLLLKQKAEVNPISQRDQLSPLRLATALGHFNIVSTLIDTGAALEGKEWVSILTLSYAINENYLRILDKLISYKPLSNSIRMSLIFIAARKGFTEIFLYLIKPLNVIALQQLDDTHLTLLQVATIHDHLPIIRLLVEKKADINQQHIVNQQQSSQKEFEKKNSDGNTALHYAACFNRKIILLYLLDHKANPNIQNVQGKTALHFAVTHDPCIVTSLLAAKAKTSLSDGDGATPLHFVFNNTISARLLIDAKANINQRDREDRTPLHYTVCYGNVETTRILLEEKAGINARSRNYKTPLFALCEQIKSGEEDRYSDLIMLLLESGANLSLKAKIYYTDLITGKGMSIFDIHEIPDTIRETIKNYSNPIESKKPISKKVKSLTEKSVATDLFHVLIEKGKELEILKRYSIKSPEMLRNFMVSQLDACMDMKLPLGEKTIVFSNLIKQLFTTSNLLYGYSRDEIKRLDSTGKEVVFIPRYIKYLLEPQTQWKGEIELYLMAYCLGVNLYFYHNGTQNNVPLLTRFKNFSTFYCYNQSMTNIEIDLYESEARYFSSEEGRFCWKATLHYNLDHGIRRQVQEIFRGPIHFLFPKSGLDLSAFNQQEEWWKESEETQEDKTLLVNLKAPPFLVEERSKEQQGWNCFDVAIGLPRHELVQFALLHSHEFVYQQLLALEIKTAAAITVLFMNASQAVEKSMENRQSKLMELFYLLEIAQQLGELEHSQLVTDCIQQELTESKSENQTLNSLRKFGLPERMHTTAIQKIINDYTAVEELVQNQIRQCNDLLGYGVGQRLSFDHLKHFFSIEENVKIYQAAYESFLKINQTILEKEKPLNDYCTHPDTYQNYVSEYYGNHGWFAFQPSLKHQTVANTSMVDIAARCKGKPISIYQRKNHRWEEIYRTAEQIGETIHVEYRSAGQHFVALKPNPNYSAVVKMLLTQVGLFNKSQKSKGLSLNNLHDVPEIISRYMGLDAG